MADCESPVDPYAMAFRALSLVPPSHYLFALAAATLIFLYAFLELHFLQDLLSGFRGCPVDLTFHPFSHIYDGVASKCSILHGRYLVTPWLASPHIQTVFLNFFGRAPSFSYKRTIFHASDGGTIALDWLTNYDVHDGRFHMIDAISRDDSTPIMLVIPGLTSDSQCPYIRHLAYSTAKSGWNVVVSNHRGLGGVSITSDCFYNAGWTEDLRVITSHLHHEYPKAPLFLVGTSIGANVLVKYLGEEGDNVPIAGAVAICSPWDLLIGDRFIRRRLAQIFYDKALTIGLQGYAQLHEPHYTRLANWEGIIKSRTIRDFDHHATRVVGKYETVDTYYRRCSSASYVGNVAVPLLCISSLDDPVCTREAIPWDECRANKNVVLATLEHGGHLAFFEGITASRLWWVGATNEFLRVLHSSQYMHIISKTPNTAPQSSLDSTIDSGPFVSVADDGLVVAMGNEQMEGDLAVDSFEPHDPNHQNEETEAALAADPDEPSTKPKPDSVPRLEQTYGQVTSALDSKPSEEASPVKRCLELLRRQNKYSIWLLAYIAVVTTWPFLGSLFSVIYRKKLRNVIPSALLRR